MPIPTTAACDCWPSPNRAGELKDAVQEGIQRGEERWLSVLSADERRVFLRALQEMTRVVDTPRVEE